VEDVSLLILTPLIVLVRTGFKESNSYTKLLLSRKFLKSRSFPKLRFSIKNKDGKDFYKSSQPLLWEQAKEHLHSEAKEVGAPHSKNLQTD
jgi:hypothetical protein